MVTGESAKETVKTIVQGMPAVAVYPWLLTRVRFAAQAASGATRIRHSLRLLLISRAVRFNNSDISCRENADACFPSLRAKRSNPESRAQLWIASRSLSSGGALRRPGGSQ